jgi:hypothetical protein
MTRNLPLLSAQLAFGLLTERTGRRANITLLFRTPPARLVEADVRTVLEAVTLNNPAFSYRIRFSRGTAFQEWEPSGLDFTELALANEDEVPAFVTDAIENFVGAPDGPPMSACLLRSPESDHVLLLLDHAVVDEQSLLLIKHQLDTSSTPDDGKLARYQAAVESRRAAEDKAVSGPGVSFWEDRLAAAGEFPPPRARTGRYIPFAALAPVQIPRPFRGSLFPYVLFSIHCALRDVGAPGPTVIGYPWNTREAAYADVVGCFMNTVLSIGPAGPYKDMIDPGNFVRSWYDEVDRADVPYHVVTSLDSTFSGWVNGQLSYTHGATLPLRIAGVEAVEVPLSHSRPPDISSFAAAATVRGDELRLRLLIDDRTTGYGAQELGERWRCRLHTAISSVPGRKC